MPRLFSNNEYADIHYVYGFCDGNAEQAVHEYGRRFPNRRRPNARVFINTHIRFCEFGLRKSNEQYPNNNRVHIRRNMQVLQLFDINRRLSTRRAAQQLNISQSKVWRTLRADRRHPYHLQPVQNLEPEDLGRRLAFSNWLLAQVNNNNDFLRRILWTDEATFTRNGVVNYHNLHVWDHENPHEIRPRSFQSEFKVNIWVGLIDNNLCGPHILPDRLNAGYFYQFLNNDLNNLMEEVPLWLRHEGWIQLDGAPPHYGRIVREWLNTNYPQRWIGRSGPVAWPPRSPDLNPLDYYLWSTVKNKVYEITVRTREELVLRIQEACNEIRQDPDQILRAIQSLHRRCRKCIEVGGNHFEQML